MADLLYDLLINKGKLSLFIHIIIGQSSDDGLISKIDVSVFQLEIILSELFDIGTRKTLNFVR